MTDPLTPEPITDDTTETPAIRATLPQDGPTEPEAPPARCLNGEGKDCGWTGDLCPECGEACPRHPTPGCALCKERKQASLEASRRGGLASAAKRAASVSAFRERLGDLLTVQDCLRWMAEIPPALLDGTLSAERAAALLRSVDVYLKALTGMEEPEERRVPQYEDELDKLGDSDPASELQRRLDRIHRYTTLPELERQKAELEQLIAMKQAEEAARQVETEPVPTEAPAESVTTVTVAPIEAPASPVEVWEPSLRCPPEYRWSHMRPTQHKD